ncbi:MAG TPA: hypothetical protein VGB65_13410 [Allosphingosinicella sp.]|jgi:hypothetical protein
MPAKTPAFAIAAALLLAGCQAKVSHPTKTLAEQQVDIEGCSRAANDKYWMDPIAALLNAYDCLEAKGYRKGDADVSAQVQRAVNNKPAVGPPKAPGEAPKPCRVPCAPRR